jgi:hypothetical protein
MRFCGAEVCSWMADGSAHICQFEDLSMAYSDLFVKEREGWRV